MKINLLYPDRETPGSFAYPDPHIIINDLNLNLIFETASRGGENAAVPVKDNYIYDTMRRIMMIPLTDGETLKYRQGIVKDAVDHFDFISGLYDISTRAEKAISEHLKGADKIKGGSLAVIEKFRFLKMLAAYLSELKKHVTGNEKGEKLSEAFSGLILEYNDEFEDATFNIIDELEFLTSGGILRLRAAELSGLKAGRYYIERLEALEFKKRKKQKTGTIAKIGKLAGSIINPDRKEYDSEEALADGKALEEGACAYILSFYEDFMKESAACLKNLKQQSAFLLGCARLYERFTKFRVPLCFPETGEKNELSFSLLCETCLCLYMRRRPVANDLHSSNVQVMLVTGANQGGKSTYLRSIALAQVFMQAGMFVTAESFKSGIFSNIFTHFTRREDSTMNSGRLDEELKRMSKIIERLSDDSIIFLNESFATTTEKEGSIIAYELTKAVLNTKVRMLTVTHLLEYAHKMYEEKDERVIFLSAGRNEDGSRSFKINENPPEDTSYGMDLFVDIIGKE